MKQVKIDELEKGDLIICRWNDASEIRAKIEQHAQPEVYVHDIGVFLGVSGGKRKHIVIGKDVAEGWNEWGAARIPLDLVESITLLMKRDDLAGVLKAVNFLIRKIKLRRYKRYGGELIRLA